MEMTNTKDLIPRKSPWKRFREQYYSPQLHRKWSWFSGISYNSLLVVAEAIATYLLVFMTAGAAAINGSDETRLSQLGSSIVGGLIVAVMIYAVGHISGAFMNPAVTVAFASIGQIPWQQAPFYAAAQFTGSILASFTLRVLLHPIKRLGTTSPSGSDLQSLVMEIVVTFSMMFIATAVTIDTKAIGELGGVAVGSAVCITSIFAGPVSGGSMNPARTLGPAIASNYYKGLWVYFLGPFVGTLLAAWSYRFIWTKDKPINAISVSSRSRDDQIMPIQAMSVCGNDDQEVIADDPLNPFKKKLHQIEPALDYPSGYQSSYTA